MCEHVISENVCFHSTIMTLMTRACNEMKILQKEYKNGSDYKWLQAILYHMKNAQSQYQLCLA